MATRTPDDQVVPKAFIEFNEIHGYLSSQNIDVKTRFPFFHEILQEVNEIRQQELTPPQKHDFTTEYHH